MEKNFIQKDALLNLQPAIATQEKLIYNSQRLLFKEMEKKILNLPMILQLILLAHLIHSTSKSELLKLSN
jgi:hypothetical protein